MNFHKSFKKCSIPTPDIRKQPQTSLESIKIQIKVQQNMATRGSYMYVHNSKVKIFRGIPKMLVLSNFLKILMV